jgi:hypothetical protein
MSRSGRDPQIEDSWQLVARLGHVVPSERQLAEAGAMLGDRSRPLDARALLRVSTVQGVLPHVLTQLERLPAAEAAGMGPFLEQARSAVRAAREDLQGLFEQLRTFTARAHERDVRFLTIKGAYLQSLYPHPERRAMCDIDLLLHPASCWRAVDVLAEIGYPPQRLKLDATPAGRSLSERTGVLHLGSHGGDDDLFDLHLGGFPGCGGIVVEGDLWASTETIEAAGAEVPVPRLQDAIVIHCAHVSRHGHTTLRDLNDLYVCLTSAPLDLERLLAELRRNSVHQIFHGLVSRLPEAERAALPATLRERSRRRAPCLVGRLLTVRNEKLLSEENHLPAKSFGMTPGRLFSGRLVQATFLYHHARRRHRRLAALGEAARGVYFLWRYGRSFRTHQHGAVDNPTRHLVGTPLTVELGTELQLDDAAVLAHARGHRAAWVGPGVLAWDVGSADELLLTPYLVLAPATTYDGSLDAARRRRLEQRAHDVIGELRKAGTAGLDAKRAADVHARG